MSSSLAFALAGALAIFTGIFHCIVGERRMIRAIRFPNHALLTLSRGMIWVSGVAWVGAGVLYIAVGRSGPGSLVAPIVLTQAVVLGIGIACNFRATRGRHPGWALLAFAVALSLYGWSALP